MLLGEPNLIGTRNFLDYTAMIFKHGRCIVNMAETIASDSLSRKPSLSLFDWQTAAEM